MMLSIIRCIADIPVNMHHMGSDRVNSQAAGILGSVSSAISLYTLWGNKWFYFLRESK